MKNPSEEPSCEQLREENSRLRERLLESEETLRAIRQGEVDALVIYTAQGEKIYTLKGAEQPYRILFEQMNEAAITISGEGTILFSNKRFADLLQVRLEEVMGSSIESFILPLDRTAFQTLVKESSIAPTRGEIAFNAEDGTIVPVLVSVTFLPTPDLPTYCLIATDLTERKEVETALRQAHDDLEMKVKERTGSLERANELLKSEIIERLIAQRQLTEEREKLSGALGIIDQAAIAMDGAGKVSFMNRMAEKITGWKLAEVDGAPITSVIRMKSDGVEPQRETLDRFLKSATLSNFRINLLSKDGATCPIVMKGVAIRDKNGSSIGFVTVFRRVGARSRYLSLNESNGQDLINE